MLVDPERHLTIGALAFEGMDQIDLTGPFAVLGRIPNSDYRIYSKGGQPVRDSNGLILTPEARLSDAPQLDVLHIPGGPGGQLLMEDDEVITWLQSQSASATALLSVCTGALLLGAAGLLVGRRATTHWASFHLLALFGATPVEGRVLVDGNRVFSSGVTAGIDAALRLAAELRGDDVAQRIQLHIEYAPEPPFDSGTPETAPAHILRAARTDLAELMERREATARKIGMRLSGQAEGQ